MKSRILMQFVFSTALLLGASSGAQAADPIKVSASFSILGDMVKQVGSAAIWQDQREGHTRHWS
jgi:ABC-type Zn uptake system ZnuABC Zn-binding protein ZnuA